MTNHNTHPVVPSSEQGPPAPLPERVQWDDGGPEGYLYRTPGDTLELGYYASEPTPSAQDLHYGAGGVGVMRTESGTRYIMGLGTVIREDAQGKRTAANLPVELPPMIVGQPWEIPGFSNTAPVKSMLLRDSQNAPVDSKGVVRSDKENPFPHLQQELVQAGRALSRSQS